MEFPGFLLTRLFIDQDKWEHYDTRLMSLQSISVYMLRKTSILLVLGTLCTIAVLLRGTLQGLAQETRSTLPLPRAGAELVGTLAQDWHLDGWLDGKERTLQGLRGKVVLVRFWTSTCSFCAASLPALSALYQQKRSQGLEVIGLHHPKPFGSSRSATDLKQVLLDWKVDIPVGLDNEWKTLKRCWLNGHPRSATSATLLINRKGIIRWVHPGVEYHPDGGQAGHEQCARDWEDLVRAVEVLLQESP